MIAGIRSLLTLDCTARLPPKTRFPIIPVPPLTTNAPVVVLSLVVPISITTFPYALKALPKNTFPATLS